MPLIKQSSGTPGTPVDRVGVQHARMKIVTPSLVRYRYACLTYMFFFVILVHRTLRGLIQDRRTSRARLYHCATATEGGLAKLLTFYLHKGCPIYATLVATQVRVPPGARNFYRRKSISFLPYLLSLFVSVKTSTLFSSTRALPRDKEEFVPSTEYQLCLSHWAFVSLERAEFI